MADEDRPNQDNPAISRRLSRLECHKAKLASPTRAGREARTPRAISEDTPATYPTFLTELKQRIRTARLHASLSINRELLLLYWGIGRDILARQNSEGWGAKVIERLGADLRRAFPEMTGISTRSLKYMRAFAEAWPDETIVQQLLHSRS